MLFTPQANLDLDKLKNSSGKALGYLETNPRYPEFNTHKYNAIRGLNGEEIFEAYAENKKPAAYRIFWQYGPNKRDITIVAITAYP